MYPDFLQPSSVELFIVDGSPLEIPKCLVSFDRWNGEPIKNTFGGKPILLIEAKPMFAELAILTYFIKDGWQARWIETYGKPKLAPIKLSAWIDDKHINQVDDPIQDESILKIFSGIASLNDNSYAGCWDVMAWKGERIVFAESKRKKKDSIRNTQTNWLRSGLEAGLSTDNFLVVKWEM
jgi:hypothetical protein